MKTFYFIFGVIFLNSGICHLNKIFSSGGMLDWTDLFIIFDLMVASWCIQVFLKNN